ncbi:MAG: zf-HC2 domain-containing protein [Acidimicrobiia bacterium]
MLHLAHRRFARSVTPYADGELDLRDAQILADHLRDCEDCSHDLGMVMSIKGSLHRLAAGAPPTLAATRLRRWAAGLEE